MCTFDEYWMIQDFFMKRSLVLMEIISNVMVIIFIIMLDGEWMQENSHHSYADG